MLTNKANYLSAGAHIGMKSCTKYMKKFIYKIREDGLTVFNLKEADKRISIAANFLSKFNNILIASHKQTSQRPAKKFAEAVDGKAILARFSPGTLTNPSYKDFYEPDVVVIIDPLADSQAIKEAKKKRVPIVSMCGTINDVDNIDLIIPINNNGKKSIAIVLWLLAREVLKKKGKIKKDSDFKLKLEDFIAK